MALSYSFREVVRPVLVRVQFIVMNVRSFDEGNFGCIGKGWYAVCVLACIHQVQRTHFS